ncbi:hypothetical protein [Micromonospora sp. HUAS LYJ1]|uniref:hypothetical protein n=1 Tax=Micromonospora sp. HUAS LYJ1 TaxID=3061626 RepID=UPI0026730826|nr:hypothetical protein [Micromonospora sp. HUAS LYJ1]WKU05354.1 hypothetical protein Q2K16_32235 [Micromonospora sp. HUAS LYJ1]
MNRNPSSSNARRFTADSIPASATTTSRGPGGGRGTGVRTGISSLVSALLAANRSTTGDGVPVAGGEQPDLRVDRAFLARPALAQPVFAFDLDVQRGHAIGTTAKPPPQGAHR